MCGGQLGWRHCIGVHWVVFLFVYCLIWGVLVWVRSLGLGLLLRGLVRILSVGLLRVARPSVPIRRRRLGRMLILSGHRISTLLVRI